MNTLEEQDEWVMTIDAIPSAISSGTRSTKSPSREHAIARLLSTLIADHFCQSELM